jgi:tetratricopeptide (TPR) repeat protein
VLKARLTAAARDPAHFNQASAQVARDSAAWYLNRAIELNPDDAQNYMFFAYWFLSQGDLVAAREVLQRGERAIGGQRTAAAFFASVPNGSRILAQDAWYRGLLERVSLRSADLDSSEYYAHKAMAGEGMGDTARARAYWDSVLTIRTPRPASASPSHSSNVALAYAAEGDGRRALALAGSLSKTHPWSCSAAEYTLALVETAVGLGDEAAGHWEDLVLRKPGAFATPKFLSLDPGLRQLRANPGFRRLLGEY